MDIECESVPTKATKWFFRPDDKFSHDYFAFREFINNSQFDGLRRNASRIEISSRDSKVVFTDHDGKTMKGSIKTCMDLGNGKSGYLRGYGEGFKTAAGYFVDQEDPTSNFLIIAFDLVGFEIGVWNPRKEVPHTEIMRFNRTRSSSEIISRITDEMRDYFVNNIHLFGYESFEAFISRVKCLDGQGNCFEFNHPRNVDLALPNLAEWLRENYLCQHVKQKMFRENDGFKIFVDGIEVNMKTTWNKYHDNVSEKVDLITDSDEILGWMQLCRKNREDDFIHHPGYIVYYEANMLLCKKKCEASPSRFDAMTREYEQNKTKMTVTRRVGKIRQLLHYLLTGDDVALKNCTGISEDIISTGDIEAGVCHVMTNALQKNKGRPTHETDFEKFILTCCLLGHDAHVVINKDVIRAGIGSNRSGFHPPQVLTNLVFKTSMRLAWGKYLNKEIEGMRTRRRSTLEQMKQRSPRSDSNQSATSRSERIESALQSSEEPPPSRNAAHKRCAADALGIQGDEATNAPRRSRGVACAGASSSSETGYIDPRQMNDVRQAGAGRRDENEVTLAKRMYDTLVHLWTNSTSATSDFAVVCAYVTESLCIAIESKNEKKLRRVENALR